MKKIAFFLLSSFFLGPLSINAQNSASHHSCGTSVETQEVLFKNMVELRHRYPNVATSRAIAYIPVWFHLVAKTDGTGRTTEANVAEMLCEWNKIYAANGLEMQFYIKGFNRIDYDPLYNGPQSFDGSNRMAATKKADGMNVYLVNNSGTGTEPAGTVILAYYANRQTTTDAEYASDWIVVSNNQVNAANATTIAHESGHFFSLAHTFYGWENSPFQPTPSAPCAPASVNYNGRIITVERVARTGTSRNCDVAADGFCDTPEDYNFGFGANSCTYSGIAKDPQCVSVNPDETNVMGYFLGCLKKFSAEQITAIRNNYLNHAKRAYLRSGNITPALTAAIPTLISPANSAITPYFNNISLDWSDVPSAIGYTVEVSKFSSFTSSKAFFVTPSNFNVNALNTANYFVAGVTYYWRIKAIVPFNNCTNSASGTFRTGTLNAVNEIAGVSQLTVSPIPLPINQLLSIEMTSETAFDGKIRLFNMTGQLMKSENRRFEIGYSVQNISVADLTIGTYILTIESDKGVLNKRIVIQ
jgi:hypothetical protein